MCGINGIFTYDNAPEQGAIQRMNDALAHRGPDNEGVWEGDGLALGHRRLSIIDLSDDGNQPMVAPEGDLVLIYNGELYNYRELRSELGDANFTTQTDTEVVMRAFRKWGSDAFARFNGMFAIAIWDRNKQQLTIARDRLGIKPLYYHLTDSHLVFSSELPSLLASNKVPRKLNRDALVDYLRYQTVHAPDTILQGVHMLPPGHLLSVKSDDVELKPWWELTGLGHHTLPPPNDYGQLCTNIKALLTSAVERRLVADVPFGAFLSGGIDSSAIVGLMSQVSPHRVRTFSVVFDEEEFSEAKYARMISERFGTEHHEIRLTPNDFLEGIPAALDAMSHPSGDGPNTWTVSKVTKEAGITMALSGLGGDELFAGYPIFKRSMALEEKRWLQSWPVHLRRPVASVNRLLRPGVASDKIHELMSLDYFDLDHTYPISRKVLLDRYIAQLLRRSKLPADRLHEFAKANIGYGSSGGRMPLLSRVSVAEMGGYMQNVLLRDTDQMSMDHALEVRVPFLDHTLVEYILRVNDSVKYPHTPKKLLTDSLGDLLPREIIDRPKMGFVFPWMHWMKNELRDFCEQRLQSLGAREPFNPGAVMELWNRFLKNDPRILWARLWPMVVLGDWLDKNNIED